MDIIDFVRMFLNVIEHKEDETIYMVMAIVELFRRVSENMNMATHLKFQNLTDLMCQSYGESLPDQHVIPTNKLPKKNKFDHSLRLRQIDIVFSIIFILRIRLLF